MPNILLIDDNFELRRTLCRLLESAGYHVTEAKDGTRGIDLLKADNAAFDLIITDVVMPGENGFDVIQAAQAHCPSAKLLAISGGSRDLPAKWSLKMAEMIDVDAVLYKPFQNDEFRELVGNLLGENHSG